MKLFVNKSEVPFLKGALRRMVADSVSPEQTAVAQRLLERVTLCEQLQDNERGGKNANQCGSHPDAP